MQEMVLNFLTRMAFVLGEAHKEPDYQVITHAHSVARHLLIQSEGICTSENQGISGM